MFFSDCSVDVCKTRTEHTSSTFVKEKH